MGLGWILLLVIIGGGIWQLFRPMNGNSSSRTPTHFSDRQETPIDILKNGTPVVKSPRPSTNR